MADQSSDAQACTKTQTAIDEALRLCRDAEYKVPGKHETWDAYHEGQSAFADKIEQILDQAGPPRAATLERVGTALNRAADEVLALAGDNPDDNTDGLVCDAVNLVVNAGLHFLEHPEACLEDAVRQNYDHDFAEDLLESLR